MEFYILDEEENSSNVSKDFAHEKSKEVSRNVSKEWFDLKNEGDIEKLRLQLFLDSINGYSITGELDVSLNVQRILNQTAVQDCGLRECDIIRDLKSHGVSFAVALIKISNNELKLLENDLKAIYERDESTLKTYLTITDTLDPRKVDDVATQIRKYLNRYNIKANVEVNPVTDNKEVAYTITCECYRYTDNV